MRTLPNEQLGREIIAGDGARERAPERRCVLTGQVAARDTLLRLAVSPSGEVLPDALAKAPGRGAWVGVTRTELEDAIATGRLKAALSRAFKTSELNLSPDMGARAETALVRALLDRLGLEMRFGKLQLGADRIAGLARSGAVAWLAHAADASEDGARKLDQALRVGTGREGSSHAGIRLPLDRAALSVALGRENVVHLALTDAAAAERVALALKRLLHFTGAGQAAADVYGNRTSNVAPDAATTN